MQTVHLIPIDKTQLHEGMFGVTTIDISLGIFELSKKSNFESFFHELGKLIKNNPFPPKFQISASSGIEGKTGEWIKTQYLSSENHGGYMGYITPEDVINLLVTIPNISWYEKAVHDFLKQLPEEVGIVVIF